MPFIKATFWNSYFKILVEPRYEQNDDIFAKYCQTPGNHHFQEVFCCWSSERHFGVLTIKFAPNPILAQNMANLQNTVTGLVIHRFPLVYFCVSCKQHFGVLAVKFLLNQITTHKMASLQNIVTRLTIIVLSYSYSAYHQNDTLELLPWFVTWTNHDAKDGQFAKFCHTPKKSSFTLSNLVLIVWTTLWSY